MDRQLLPLLLGDPRRGHVPRRRGHEPAVGEAGRDQTVAEYRVETVVPAEKLEAVIAALRRAHPYEEPAFDVYARVES